jgi:predicted metal-dependent hydrolase
MGAAAPFYDDRYLAGIVLFNRHDFFEAHEVWEDLWMDRAGPEKRFVQGLIQAAVGLLHFGNGNVRGARKLYLSSRDYMQPYGSHYLGMDNAAFWQQMGKCFQRLLATDEPDRSIELDLDLVPAIALEPPPAAWPDPAAFLENED